ncbi:MULTISPECIES: hypothetical protein [Burkholderia]|uniref:hypothetical protein n=1 Tax=Burkholderia TaxID=32008 RepID=UPI000930F183|nr:MULTISPECIES: hypothetical protein [Burkholderia]MCA8010868.1 hypothetical protein [Burkholderia vietnamiensis]MCA8144598.1 hypothetical protein [Burkholderia vietnamiensis]MCA8265043.1 hypothetical protein [Burkholderia vietnamiensis]MCA8390356.1 hypothetical protein [Burkholderia vietnamiensis]MCO1346146.1 hypothetical protein [Burkholderia vietnamiensis]
MRILSAALVGAAAALPTLVLATTSVPDPSDAAASVPAVAAPSAFDDYQPYRDGEAPTWQQVNRAVTPARPSSKREATSSSPSNTSHHSTHERDGQ